VAKGIKLDIEFGSFDEGWEADNKAKLEVPSRQTLPPAEHRLVFRREKRRGKPVTLVGEFFLENDEAKALLKRIKKRLGSGGTFKEGWMELQGEKADALRPLLEAEGFRFKR
jgi:translation initiation factor 1